MIPVYEPDLSGNEENYLLDAFRSGWISSKGEYVDRFEQAFANFIGSNRPGISVSNGTVALHLALLALNIGPEHEVLVPNFTYVACANAVKYVGALPIFFGSDEEDLQPSVSSALGLISKKTKAIILPHLYGCAADVIAFRNLATERGIFLIEDCAEAIGTTLDNQHVGRLGDISTFSFFGNKTLTTGEGGMVFTQNLELDLKIRKLKSQGVSKPGSYDHDAIGYNYRMTNLQAAIGLAQVERADQIISKKRENHALYKEQLANNERFRLLEPLRGESSYWMETLIFHADTNVPELISKLKDSGIESRPGFSEMTTLNMYKNSQVDLTKTSLLGKRVMNIPSSPLLTNKQIKYVAQSIAKHAK